MKHTALLNTEKPKVRKKAYLKKDTAVYRLLHQALLFEDVVNLS